MEQQNAQAENSQKPEDKNQSSNVEANISAEADEKKKGFRNGIIAAVVIVVLVAAGIYFATKNDDEAKTEDEQATEQSASEVKQEIAKEEIEELKKNPTEVKVEGAHKDGKYTEVANKGDGVTQLGRRALANYEKLNSDKLPEKFSNEHRIYVEDYLMKHTSSKWLGVGDQFDFSDELVEEAIEKASALTDSQLQNLTQYSVSVFGK